MFPNSPYAVPSSSFNAPVSVPGVDPDSDPLVTVSFSCAWLPYVLGALTQLLQQTAWKTNAPGLDLVQQQASTLISMFATAGLDCGVLPVILSGIDCGDDCMSCCLRVQNGVLQCFSCGVWTDVPGQQPGGTQPGPGSPQPPPGGGSAQYEGCLNPLGAWFSPTPVNTGDMISVTNITGAWNDTTHDPIVWFCGDGNVFVAGTCIPGTTILRGTDPLPSSPFMMLLALINGVYYPLTGSGFTVPGGVTNAPMLVVCNIPTGENGVGQVCFTLKVQNNVAITGCSVFDFTASNGGWSPSQLGGSVIQADYTGGQGWGQHTPVTFSHDNIGIQIACPGAVINRIKTTMSAAATWAGPFYFNIYDTTGFSLVVSSALGDVAVQDLTFSPHTFTSPLTIATGNTPSGAQVNPVKVQRVEIHWTGTNPFPGIPAC